MKIKTLHVRLRLTLVYLLGIAILFSMMGCGSTSGLQNAQGQAITSSRKFSKVTVQDFKLSTKEIGEKVTASKAYFADRIATALNKTGRFASVKRNATADANTLVIDGVITKYEEGNPTLRLFIGMGAGSSFFESDVKFRDSKGAVIGQIKVDKNSWALGGGIAAGQNPEAFMNGAADKIAEEAVKVAK